MSDMTHKHSLILLFVSALFLSAGINADKTQATSAKDVIDRLSIIESIDVTSTPKVSEEVVPLEDTVLVEIADEIIVSELQESNSETETSTDGEIVDEVAVKEKQLPTEKESVLQRKLELESLELATKLQLERKIQLEAVIEAPTPQSEEKSESESEDE